MVLCRSTWAECMNCSGSSGTVNSPWWLWRKTVVDMERGQAWTAQRLSDKRRRKTRWMPVDLPLRRWQAQLEVLSATPPPPPPMVKPQLLLLLLLQLVVVQRKERIRDGRTRGGLCQT